MLRDGPVDSPYRATSSQCRPHRSPNAARRASGPPGPFISTGRCVLQNASISVGVGGRPVKSNVTRRIRCASVRIATGCKFLLLALPGMKRSILDGHLALLVRALRLVKAATPSAAPAVFRRAAAGRMKLRNLLGWPCYAVLDPASDPRSRPSSHAPSLGMRRFGSACWIRCRNRLFSGSPGIIAGPCFRQSAVRCDHPRAGRPQAWSAAEWHA